MKHLRNIIKEAVGRKKKTKKMVVWTFGRFSPPTNGHQKLVETVKSVANRVGGEARVYPSPSFDSKKNPLKHSDKVRFMREMFPGVKVVDDAKLINPFFVLTALFNEGVTDFVFVVGSDRLQNFKNSMSSFIEDPRFPETFDSYQFVSAGQRDPDADDVTGMSASKMRQFALSNNITAFTAGVPSGTKPATVVKMFNLVKKGLGLREMVESLGFGINSEVVNMETMEYGKVQNIMGNKVIYVNGKGIPKMQDCRELTPLFDKA